MRKRPMVLLACMFLIGILIRNTGLFPMMGIGLFLYLYATPWKERGIRFAVVAVGMPVALVLGVFCMSSQQDFRDRYLSQIEDGQGIRLVGKIDNVEEKAHCIYYYMTDCSVELSDRQVPCNDVLAYISSDRYSAGQILVLQGTSTLFDEATNEGQFDARSFYRSRKIDFGIWVDETKCVEQKEDRFRDSLLKLREKLRLPFVRYADDGGVLATMLLGDKTDLDSEIRSLYQKSGIAHVLAISGLHISMLGMALYRLLRRRCGFSYGMAGIAVGAFLVAYMLMTGNAVSAQRATGMLIVYLVADVLGHAYDMLSALSLVAMVLLWQNPFLVDNSGFQFSVVAVIGIGVGQSVLIPMINMYASDADIPGVDASGAGALGADVSEVRALGADVSVVETLRTGMSGAGASGVDASGVSVFKRRRTMWLHNLAISATIQLFTLPLVAYYNYEIPVYAILLNIPVLALIPYVLGLAVVGSLAGQIAILQPVSYAACGISSMILKGYHRLCDISIVLPGASLITGQPSILRITLYYSLLGVFYFGLWCSVQWKEATRAEKDRGQQREKGPLSAGNGYVKAGKDARSGGNGYVKVGKDARSAGNRYMKEENMMRAWRKKNLELGKGKQKGKMKPAIKMLFGVFILFLVLFFRGRPEFEVDLLDVGQGDAVYVRTSEGISIMIDGGSTDVKNVGMYRILPFLKAKGIRKISYWFVSHTDEDHISGLIEVMESGYCIENLVFAEAQKEDKKALQLVDIAYKNGICVRYMSAGDVLYMKKETSSEMRPTRIECLYPTSNNDSEDVNDRCLVLRYEDENFSGFFGGDISSEVEEQLVRNDKCKNTDFLKASHHGSKFSNSDAFLQVLCPRLTIASAGKKNRYGHPSPDAIERIRKCDSDFYCTIACGRIRVRVETGHMIVEPFY